MADNTAQDGTNTIATDDIGGVHFQKVKVMFGPSDTATAVEAAVGLPTNVLGVVAGTGATNLGKAEDAAHSSGDVGVAVLAVRKDTATALAGTDGDYAPLEVDAAGSLHVTQAALQGGVDEIAGVAKTDVFLDVTNANETEILAAPASGNFYRIYDVAYCLEGATATRVSLRFGASNTDHVAYWLQSQGSCPGKRINYMDLPVDDNVYVNLTIASDVLVNIWYSEETP